MLSPGNTLLSSLSEPLHCLRVVLPHAGSADVADSGIALSLRKTLSGSLVPPLQGLRCVLLNADAVEVAETEIGLSRSKTLGGTEAEFPGNIQKTMDGGYVIAGSAESDDGDVSGNHGNSDFWIVKLSPESSPTSTPTSLPLELYPNPATHTISLQVPQDHATGTVELPLSIRITDLLGKEISQQTLQPGKAVDIAALPNGMYILTATDALGKVYSGRFMKLE